MTDLVDFNGSDGSRADSSVVFDAAEISMERTITASMRYDLQLARPLDTTD